MRKPIYLTNKVDEALVEYLIHPTIANYIQKYFELSFYRKRVSAPYFINTKRRKDLRALVGKGTPEEMVLETKVWAQVKGVNLKTASAEEIRDLMLKVGIGIDCSGLIVHTLNNYYHATNQRSLYRRLSYENNSLRALLARIFRPAENVSANTLTADENCERIAINDVRPGDFIRGVGKQRNAYHIAFVTKVNTRVIDGQETVYHIEYIHSHRGYGEANGVRRGLVEVKDPFGNILDQEWIDNHTDGVNYLLESDLKPYPDESGFRRLKSI